MSKRDDHKMLSHLRETEYVRRLGKTTIMPKSEYLDLKLNHCPGCGQRMQIREIWWGQEFCKPCVDRLDPNRTWRKGIGILKGFKGMLK